MSEEPGAAAAVLPPCSELFWQGQTVQDGSRTVYGQVRRRDDQRSGCAVLCCALPCC